jgi:hypothetical protein
MNKRDPDEHAILALESAGGVVDGSRVRREYPITPIEATGRRGKALTADRLIHRNTC